MAKLSPYAKMTRHLASEANAELQNALNEVANLRNKLYGPSRTVEAEELDLKVLKETIDKAKKLVSLMMP